MTQKCQNASGVLPLGGHIFHVLGDMGASLEVGENDPQKGEKSDFGIPFAIALISFGIFGSFPTDL